MKRILVPMLVAAVVGGAATSVLTTWLKQGEQTKESQFPAAIIECSEKWQLLVYDTRVVAIPIKRSATGSWSYDVPSARTIPGTDKFSIFCSGDRVTLYDGARETRL